MSKTRPLRAISSTQESEEHIQALLMGYTLDGAIERGRTISLDEFSEHLVTKLSETASKCSECSYSTLHQPGAYIHSKQTGRAISVAPYAEEND